MLCGMWCGVMIVYMIKWLPLIKGWLAMLLRPSLTLIYKESKYIANS